MPSAAAAAITAGAGRPSGRGGVAIAMGGTPATAAGAAPGSRAPPRLRPAGPRPDAAGARPPALRPRTGAPAAARSSLGPRGPLEPGDQVVDGLGAQLVAHPVGDQARGGAEDVLA